MTIDAGAGVSGLYYREDRGVMNRARHLLGPGIHYNTVYVYSAIQNIDVSW